MKTTYTLSLLSTLFLFSNCDNKVKFIHQNSLSNKVKEVSITDIDNNVFHIKDSSEIRSIIKIFKKNIKVERVPLRNTGRIDIVFFDSKGKSTLWLYCNTPDYGTLLVKEDDYSTIFSNSALDSFLKSYQKKVSDFNYW